MRNSLFSIIAVMILILVGCNRNQIVKNTSENEFFKDSCMRVIYADDTVEYRYQLVVDSIGIKMENSVQRVFLSDMKKHGSIFIDAHVTPDIMEDCRGKSFGVFDSVNYTFYKFQFAESPNFILNDKLSVTRRNSGSEFLEPSGPYLDWK